MPLTELAARARRSERAPSPVPADADLQLLGLLAAVPGLTLAERHLVALSGLTDVAERLARWVASGVVVEVPGDPVTYRLGRRPAGVARWPIDRSRAALRAYFGAWARERRGAVLRPGVDVEALRLLHADADRHREWRVVLALGAVLDAAYAVSGRWDAWRNVAATMLLAARELGDRAAEAMALHQLGTRALCLADLPTSLDLLGAALAIREGLGDRPGAAVTRHNLSLITAPPPAFVHGEPHDPCPPWWKAPRTAVTSAAIVAALVGAGLLISRPAISGPAISRPTVEFRPVAASFADQSMNRAGRPQQVDLVNTGRVTLHVTRVRVTGEHADDFSVAATTCADELAAGQACTTTVVFTPVGEGARSAALVADVTELDDGPQLPLSGAGTPPTSTGTPGTPPTSTGTPGTPPTVTSTPDGGPDGVKVPAVVDESLDAARSLLDSAGLAPGTVTPQPSDTVAEGVVISSSPGPGALVDRGSVVALTVSSGREPCVVPEVRDMDLTQAKQIIAQSCVTLGGVVPQPDADRPPDVVLATSPVPRALVEPGTPVSLTVSERGARVPDVVGRTYDEAKTAIDAAGLQVGEVKLAEVADKGLVKSSNPVAGAVVSPGQAVDLVVFDTDSGN